MNYFNTNWHPIAEEWTMFGKNQHANYFNNTSNRVESLNQKVKLIVDKNSPLTKFFKDLNIVLIISLSSEKNLKSIKTTMRTKRQRLLDPVLQRYNNHLTAYAFQKLKDEYDKTVAVVNLHYDEENKLAQSLYRDELVEFTVELCQCCFFNIMNLPCRHIIKLRERLSLNIFAEEVCATRWTRLYYNQSHPIISGGASSLETAIITYTKVKSIEEVDKFKKCQTISKEISELMSMLPNDIFNHYYEI